jgi:diguanylate cyclase (GGDEF)-like protein
MFAEQAQVAERLRRNAYSDQLTGLGNRRYLSGQVEARLEMSEGNVNGALLLILVHDLQKVNEQKGYIEGDELLRKVAEVLKQEMTMIDNAALARLAGGSFAVFLPEVSPDGAHEVAENLAAKLGRLADEHISSSGNVANIGGVTYNHSPTLSSLLAEADSAMREAWRRGPNTWQVNPLVPEQSTVVKGRNWWKETLDEVLQRKDIILFSQPVVRVGQREDIVHLELLSRIILAPGEIVSAGVFVPLAERMRMVSRLDRVVLEKAFKLQRKSLPVSSVAVNVSASSLNDPEFMNWLLDELSRLPADSLRFIFEFAEYGAVRYLDVVKRFSGEVQRLGHAIGLDHFGQSFANFGYLKSLGPEYVKIDRAFINELENESSDSHFFIGALCGVAHSLDIRVIAEGVEQEEQLRLLHELNIDAFQGYLVGKPQQM